MPVNGHGPFGAMVALRAPVPLRGTMSARGVWPPLNATKRNVNGNVK